MNGSMGKSHIPSKWSEWARSVANRSLSARRRSAIAMTIAGRARIVSVHHQHRPSVSLFRSDLQLAVNWPHPFTIVSRHAVNCPSPAGIPDRWPGMQPLHAQAVPSTMTTLEKRADAQNYYFQTLTALTQRVMARSRRIEERVARTELVTVSRGTESQSMPGEAGSRHASRTWPQPSTHSTNWTAQPQRTPAVTVEAITDNVMRQLDNRMTAWRERMGRS